MKSWEKVISMSFIVLKQATVLVTTAVKKSNRNTEEKKEKKKKTNTEVAFAKFFFGFFVVAVCFKRISDDITWCAWSKKVLRLKPKFMVVNFKIYLHKEMNSQ